MTGSTLLPVPFEAPQLPAPGPAVGLYPAVQWLQDGTEPLRWLASGITVRPANFGFEDGFGIWGAEWCASPDDLTEDDVKTGERPDIDGLTPFEAITVYGFDRNDNADLSDVERIDVRARALRNLEQHEQAAVETELAARMLTDAGTPDTAGLLLSAVASLEEKIGETNTVGFVHARQCYASIAASLNLLIRDGDTFRTPLGHRWVFGSAYAALGATLVATSPLYGWRGPISQRDATVHHAAQFIAVAERSVVLAYESVIGAVTIT